MAADEDDTEDADESAASRDDGDDEGDGVKEGLRSAGLKTEGADRPAFDAGGGAISEPDAVAEGLGLACPASVALDASSSPAWSPFADWELNQLVVADTACRTACRPLSSTELAPVAAPPAPPAPPERPSPSPESAPPPAPESGSES